MPNGVEGWGGYYLSAYGLAVKHGFRGSEAEWLEFLRAGSVQLKLDDGHMSWKTDKDTEWVELPEFYAEMQKVRESVQNANAAAESAQNKETDLVDKVSAKLQEVDATITEEVSNMKGSLATEVSELEGDLAQFKVSLKEDMDEAAQNANEQAEGAKAQAEAARAAVVSINQSKEAAEAAAGQATAAKDNATTQAAYAKAQGDRAKALADDIAADLIPILPRLDITVVSGVEVTVTCSSTSITKTSDGLVSFDLPHFGTWVISADGSAKVVEVDTVKVYPINFMPLQRMSWEEIAEIANSGEAQNYFSIGDEKTVLIQNVPYTFQIYDFNHDDLTDGGKAGITFGMKHFLRKWKMNDSRTNAGGFTGSGLYNWLQNTIFPIFEEELRLLIKQVDKRTSEGEGSPIINTESMKLFLFSPIEVGLECSTDVYKDEGETYPIFTNNYSRKKSATIGGIIEYWWLRSPDANNSISFTIVDTTGTKGVTYANAMQNVCLGFCV